jgi:trans-2,3-dihydro-3-hydroxyanthranilate isomerase
MELPFAGHPTLGVAHVLVATGRAAGVGESVVLTLEENVGPVRVRVRLRDGVPVFSDLQAPGRPEPGPAPPDPALAAALLGLGPTDLEDPPGRAETWSAGVPFLFVELRDRETLGRARLDATLWARHVRDSGAPHVYAFTLGAEEAGEVYARMFAPAMGIEEDPATGAAAAALAGLLARRDPGRAVLRCRIRQGVEMGRPSTLHLEAEARDGLVSAVRVGGEAVLVSEGTLWV